MKLNEFLLIFRGKYGSGDIQPLPEQLLSQCTEWNTWLKGLAIRDLLVSQIKRWDAGGKVLKSGEPVTDGPYVVGNDAINNVITIVAADYDEARDIAYSCPIFRFGGSVEIRMAV